MHRLRVDLHNHSCLSPCGSLEMSPSALVQKARADGIDVLGLSDHNSALNCRPFQELCREAGIIPVCGLEVTTREEVHVLCMFSRADAALSLGERIYRLLPEIRHDAERMGDQVAVNEEETILFDVEKTLTAAADIGLDELKTVVLSCGGLFIPAHVDRPVFSIISQLGFIPDDDYTALEITSLPCPPHPGSYPCISGSDAHYLEDVGKRSFIIETETENPRADGFSCLLTALKEGRVSLPPLPSYQ